MGVIEEIKGLKTKFILMLLLAIGLLAVDIFMIWFTGNNIPYSEHFGFKPVFPFSSSPIFYMGLGIGLAVLLRVLSGYLAYKNSWGSEKSEAFFKIFYVITIIIFLLSFYNATLGILDEWSGVYHIKNEFWALVFLLFLLPLDYYMADYFDKETYDILRELGRYMSDQIRKFITIYSLAIIGLYGYLFTLRIVEAVMSSIAWLYTLSVLYTFIKENIKMDFSKEYRENIIVSARKMLEAIPVIKEISELKITFVGFFSSVFASIKVASLLSDNDLSMIKENITARLVFEVPYVAVANVEVSRDTNQVKVAIPINSEDKKIVEPTSADSICLLVIKKNEKIEIEREEMSIPKDFEDPILNIREFVLKQGVDGFVVVKRDKILENELEGWFIKILLLNDANLEKAVESIKSLAKNW